MKKQFKVGDMVRLKKNLKVNETYGHDNIKLSLLNTMFFDGFKEVKEIGILGDIRLNKSNGIFYYYTPEMLTK